MKNAPNSIIREQAKPLCCPFCGGKAKIAKYAASEPEMPKPWFMVSCRSSNACSAWPTASGDTRDEAVTNWNQRNEASELQSSELMLRQILATILKRIGGSAFVDTLQPEEQNPTIQIVLWRGSPLAEVRVGR